jgi:hypothetical protein
MVLLSECWKSWADRISCDEVSSFLKASFLAAFAKVYIHSYGNHLAGRRIYRPGK